MAARPSATPPKGHGDGASGEGSAGARGQPAAHATAEVTLPIGSRPLSVSW